MWLPLVEHRIRNLLTRVYSGRVSFGEMFTCKNNLESNSDFCSYCPALLHSQKNNN